MSVKTLKNIVKRYQHSVNGITVNNREAARQLQRAFRQEAAVDGIVPPNVIESTKIVQRMLVERIVR